MYASIEMLFFKTIQFYCFILYFSWIKWWAEKTKFYKFRKNPISLHF